MTTAAELGCRAGANCSFVTGAESGVPFLGGALLDSFDSDLIRLDCEDPRRHPRAGRASPWPETREVVPPFTRSLMLPAVSFPAVVSEAVFGTAAAPQNAKLRGAAPP